MKQLDIDVSPPAFVLEPLFYFKDTMAMHEAQNRPSGTF